MTQTHREDVGRLVDHLFRREAGRLVAALTRVVGPARLDLAEDVVQEALLVALQQWPYRGIPERPAAWLARVARNRAIDRLRRDARLQHLADTQLESLTALDSEAPPEPLPDDQLALMFMCSHPALPDAARAALTLKTVGGFSVREIARAFLTSEPTIAQRLVRAKRALRDPAVRFEMPDETQLPARLDSVLEVLYLLFNEGYAAHGGENLVRADLCDEALRLGTLLTQHPRAAAPRTHALLALMLLQSARLPARLDDRGDLVRLEDQDRTRWDGARIAGGMRHLDRSAAGDDISAYHLEAAIAACHATAPTYADTDWPYIVELYDRLLPLNPSPVVTLNRAVALARARGAAAGLAALHPLAANGALNGYHLLPATLADLHRELGKFDEAAAWYRRALECDCTEPERRFLHHQLDAVKAHSPREELI